MSDIVTRREFVGAVFRLFRKPLVLAGMAAAVLCFVFRQFTLEHWRVLGAIALLVVASTVIRWLTARTVRPMSAKAQAISDTISTLLTATACFIAGAVACYQYRTGDLQASYFITAITLVAVAGAAVDRYKQKSVSQSDIRE